MKQTRSYSGLSTGASWLACSEHTFVNPWTRARLAFRLSWAFRKTPISTDSSSRKLSRSFVAMGIIARDGPFNVLTTWPFRWLGTILYMGVLVGEYPTNFLLQKLPVAKYLATNVFCWGVVIACSAAAKNFASLMVVRFLLGVFESCVQPAFIIM